MQISEKEFTILNEISNNHQPNQRLIAERSGISLGLTNLIIKCLVKKGYIKARQLTARKVQYLLTPKGFSEKLKKSYNYTLKTINSVKSIKEKIQELIISEYNKGKKEFIIQGKSELADITEIAFKSIDKPGIKCIRQNTVNGRNNKHNDSVTLIADRKSKSNIKNTISVISYLSESGLFF